jgi:phosphate starvation-inducible membrane PsiE
MIKIMLHKINKDKYHMVGDLVRFLQLIIFGKQWLGLVLQYLQDHMHVYNIHYVAIGFTLFSFS